MKKVLVLLAGMAMVCSCSNDDDNNQEEEFFNLEEGNMWVYKRYQVNAEGVETTNGITDTVRVVGQEVVDGETYFKLTHTNDFPSNGTNEELLRVDENGHLVRPSGHVVHPGTDHTYQFSRPEVSGSMAYQLGAVTNLTLEGQQYTAYPYDGYYTPDNADGPPAGIGESTSYDRRIGLVLYRCRFLSTPVYTEHRLVHYELN